MQVAFSARPNIGKMFNSQVLFLMSLSRITHLGLNRRRIYFVEAVVIFLREEHKSLIYPGDHGETIIEKKFPSFVLG